MAEAGFSGGLNYAAERNIDEEELPEIEARRPKAEVKPKLRFSYNVVCPPIPDDGSTSFTWNVMEKGSIKTCQYTNFKISLNRIKEAQLDLRRYFMKTRDPDVITTNVKDNEIYLRKEAYFALKNIKERGLIYALHKLSTEEKRRGIVTYASQNWADIICHYAMTLDVPVTIVVPPNYDDSFIEALYDHFDITTVNVPNFVNDAHSKTVEIAQSEGLYCLGLDDPNMILGQSTLGLDIIYQIDDVDVVIIPTVVVNCSVAISIAIAIKEFQSDIIVVEARCAYPPSQISFYDKVRQQEVLETELDIPVTKYKWYHDSRSIEDLFDRVIQIDYEKVVEARNYLREIQAQYERFDIVSTNTAIAYAAILTDQLDDIKGKRIVIPLFE